MYYVLFLDRARRPHWNRFNSIENFKEWYSCNNTEGIPRRELFAIAGTSTREEEIKRLWDKYDAQSSRRARSPSLCSSKIVSLFEQVFEQLDADGRLFE